MHMIQHMLLMMVGAPLVVLGGSAAATLWSLPAAWRRRGAVWLGRMQGWRVPRYLLWQPLLTFALFGLALWVWHVPALYEAALYDDLVHDLQHLMFFVVACLFWRVLVDPLSRLRLSPGLGVLYLFATSMHATFLGVFMALSPSPWYGFYETTTAAWSLSALEDQQVAGLIMWMPMCMIYALAAAVIFGLWLREDTPPVTRAPQRVEAENVVREPASHRD
jgi:cytochrome c oxidase assembly factor CtaG